MSDICPACGKYEMTDDEQLVRRALLANPGTGMNTFDAFDRICRANRSTEPALEWWVVKSENHLDKGALAYWGPFASYMAAATSAFFGKEGAAAIALPSSTTSISDASQKGERL